MSKNKNLRMKVSVAEYENNNPTGYEMVMQADVRSDNLDCRKSKTDMAYMITHWINNAQKHFDMHRLVPNSPFEGQPANIAEVVNNLRRLAEFIETGKYQASEIVSLTNVDPESTLHGDATFIFNVRSGE